MIYAGNIMSSERHVFFPSGVYLSRGCRRGKPQLNYIVSHISNTNNQLRLTC